MIIALAIVMDIIAMTGVATAANVDTGGTSAKAAHVKVAIIVGPVGSLTDDYRKLADEAAAVARKTTDRVVTVFSPNATWSAARAALKGASIVVYLGHGNGWPSPYRDSPYAATQNGLGLNPIAGGDNDAHQYFGERYIAAAGLAPGAVVILGHLCYASGNPEPGGEEPSVEVARQRVDNYAAGWMAAGAAAVVAEGYGRPAYYVKSLLRGSGTIQAMWQAAPTFNDHVVAFDSERTSSARVMIDPDHEQRGFFRSLTVAPGARIADTLRSAPTAYGPATGSESTRGDVPEAFDLARLGAHFGTPAFIGIPVAATTSAMTIPIDAATLRLLPPTVMVGIRWDPLFGDGAASPAPSAGSASGTSPAPATSVPVAPSDEPPGVNLIVSETTGKVVTTVPAIRNDAGLSILVTMPTEPGLYRVVTTLHDAEGVAFGATTQALIGGLLVQVTGSVWASYGVPAEADVDMGSAFTLRVRLANTGTLPWSDRTTELAPLLVARWIRLDDIATLGGPAGPSTVVQAFVAPGQMSVLDVALEAPTEAGRYLLLFDVQDGRGTSLAVLGVPPGMTRVAVNDPRARSHRPPVSVPGL